MKKNKLTTAVIAGLAGVAGVASVGNAVHVNPEGTGQVLIYPYYSVNNGLDTTYSVVNTTNETKAVKVRFLESAHSREVLDFNVYLSPYDVWVGALTAKVATSTGAPGHAGEQSGQHLRADNSCAPFVKNSEEFRPYEIDKDVAPGVDYTDMQRSRVGHFEVLEMGVVDAGSDFALAAKHDATGVPADCSYLESAWLSTGNALWLNTNNLDISAPTGGLFGGASVIDVANGFNVSYDAIALDAWSNGAQHTYPGNLAPSIANASPARSNVMVYDAGTNTVSVQSDLWSNGAQAVSAVLMRESIYNEYTFEAAVEGKSSWVVSFPTKFHHVDSAPVVPPFTSQWLPVPSAGVFAACENYGVSIYDREEQTPLLIDDGIISPPPPGGVVLPSFCYETNNLEFIASSGSPGDSDILGGNYVNTITDPVGGTPNGWMALNLNIAANPHSMTSVNNTTYFGLPVAGFMAQQFVNAAAGPGLMAQYGGLFNHKGTVVTSTVTGP